MTLVRDVIDFLEELAPPELAEDWDNVGLLMGDPDRSVQRVMTCLTLTEETVREARDREAELVVSHHPLPFRPLRRLTVDSRPGKLVWNLAAGQVAVYSPHTAFDSARRGINQRLADGLELTEVRALRPAVEPADGAVGGGRIGKLAETVSLRAFAEQVKQFLAVPRIDISGDPQSPVDLVAIACGAADEFLKDAAAAGCDTLVIGEARFHTLLEARGEGISVILPGHFASERFAVERIASELNVVFPDLVVWAAEHESDPLRSL